MDPVSPVQVSKIPISYETSIENSSIMRTAIELIQAGWDGVSQEHFQPSETNPHLLQGYSISIKKDDFPKIQQTVKELFSKQATSEKIANPTELPKIQTAFDRAFKMLREHLLSLSNPYAVAYIYDKIEAFCLQPFDHSNEKKMKAMFEDAGIPPDTREMLKQLVSGMLERTRDVRDVETLFQIINDMLKDLKNFNEKLQENNQKVLKDFAGWKDLETLFKIHGFLALKDNDYKKLMMCIDLGTPDKLREFIEELGDRNLFDKKKARKDLENLEYEDDLNTLLGEVCRKKPPKKEGIRTYWEYPQSFFINKTLDITDPQGESFQGTILDCTRDHNGLYLHLHDKTVIRISPSFEILIERDHYFRKLWKAILMGSITHNDIFTIENSSESDNKGAIQPGLYRLTYPRNVKGNGVLGTGLYATDYFECVLVDAQTGAHNYILQGDYKNGVINQIRVIRQEDNSTILLNVQSFERMHVAIKKEIKPLQKIHKENVDQWILIKNEINEDRVRLIKIERIKQKLNALRGELLNESCRLLLNALLDNLVKNKLKSVDFNILAKSNFDLAQEVRNLAQAYWDELKDPRSPESILLQLVLESNYAIHVDKKENIVIARTMELLKEAYIHIERMRGKDVVLFMGNTGSGKSTAIGFFMGAELVEFTNLVGEKVVQLGNEASISFYPKIGQSIGRSETIYTQGFQMPQKDYLGKDNPPIDYMLGDCSGFNDTRGGDYELCTNLSIDEAVKHSKNIRAIVVVVPANAFLIDKGNNVIELVSTVQERFPDTFKANTTESNPRVFLLVTKSNQLQGEVVKKLVDGTRINELVREIQTELKELIEKGAEMDSFEIQAVKRRLDIWKAIQLLRNQQIHFIDPQNRKQRRELLAEYSQKHTDQKGSYQKAMAGDYMQRKFGDCVQMSAHSWNRLLLDQYLEVIPKLIELCKLEKIRKNERLSELNSIKNQKFARVKRLSEQIQIQKEFLQRLRDYKSLERAKKISEKIQSKNEFLEELRDYESSLENLELRKQLFDKISKYKNDTLESEKAALKKCEEDIEKKAFQMIFFIEEITRLKNEINKSENLIRSNKSLINTFENGSRVLILFEIGGRFKEYQKLENRWMVIEEADKALSIQDGSIEFKKHYKNKTKFLMKIIDQINRLPSITQLLLSFCKGYECTFHWDSGVYPVIKMTHTIPNHEYHAAEINNLNAEICLEEIKLMGLYLQLEGDKTILGKTKEEQIRKKEIEDLQIQHDKSVKTIKEIEDSYVREQLKDWIDKANRQISNFQEEKIMEENTTEIDLKISQIVKEIQFETENIESSQKKLRDLAIIITTQWDSAKLLRQFAEFVLGNENGSQLKSSTVQQYEEFAQIFDKNKDTLLDKIRVAHGF